MKVGLRPRDVPLEPRGAVAFGPAAEALRARVEVGDADLAGVVGDGVVAVLGPAASLPWVDGVVYVAPHPDAAALWTDVRLEPDVPAAWVARKLPPGPHAWVDGRLVPLGAARRRSGG